MPLSARTPGTHGSLQSSVGVARLPGLDGLRAVAVALVVASHLITRPGIPHWHWLASVAPGGRIGVEIFFVLSGFIITWLLLSEEARKGTIDLRRFYIRRAFRILPPAFFYLAFISVLAVVHVSAAKWADIAAAAGFYRNFRAGGSYDVGHFWTLSIEEQFYLFWPLLLGLFGLFRLRARATICLLAGVSVFRHEYYRLMPHASLNVGNFLYDPLLVGCLLAIARHSTQASGIMSRRIFRSSWLIAACVCVIVLLISPRAEKLNGRFEPLIPLVKYGCIALAINYLVEGKRTPINWLLNTRPFVLLGLLSYSLYLWQQLFCITGGSLALSFPWCAMAALAGACFSYFLIEQPALRIRKRLFDAPALVSRQGALFPVPSQFDADEPTPLSVTLS